MSSDWDEIRRLAADLQRAQLSGSIQKLSERNCVEIVSRLCDLGLVEVLHTNDGREYLTPQQLQREIKDELYVARGRSSLVDLANALNVDYSHIDHQAQLLAKQDSRVNFVLGQLVDSSYLNFIAEEINEKLQLEGTVSISTITKEYDLPSEFLQEEVAARLGSVIEGYRDPHDPKVILTPSYVQRNKAKIRGALSAVTVPTPVANIINKFGIAEQLFFSLADELIKTNRLSGQITGGKKAAKATYVPAAYARAQTKWVEDFFRENGYLEYDALARLGIPDAKQFAKKRFPDGGLTFLSTCCVGSHVFDQIETSLEDALATGSWVDIAPLVPSVLSSEDAKILLESALHKKNIGKNSHIFADTVLVTRALLDTVQQSLVDLMAERAAKDVASKKYERLFVGKAAERLDMSEEIVDKKEERRKKAAGGKAGGGTQGRETKTKATKKKYGKAGKRADDGSDESGGEDDAKGARKAGASGGGVEFMTRKELEEKVSSISLLEDCPEELFEEIAAHMYGGLTSKYKAVLFEKYQSSLLANVHDKRKSHSALQECCNAAVSAIKNFEKCLSAFDGADRRNLERHLAKTLCTDLVNSVFVYVRNENGASGPEDLNADQRLKVIADLPKSTAEPLLQVHRALAAAASVSTGDGSGGGVAKFLETFEENCDGAAAVFIKKPDKKKDKNFVFAHRQALSEKLATCSDPALALHLAVTILFAVFTGSVVHASGKFVPAILGHVVSLKLLAEDDEKLLEDFQKRVLDSLSGDSSSASEELLEMLPRLKEVANNARKSGAKCDT